MFVFDNVLEKDVISYEYELYNSDQITGSFPNYSLIADPTIYLSGQSGSNVFSIAVENSTDVANIRYYGRVRTKDTSNNYSSWSPLVRTDQDSPLIGDQYLSSITAAKITAGTIGAHEVILSQAGPQSNFAAPANMAVLRSSDYDGTYDANTTTWTTGTDGWIIAGDGYAEFSSASIRGGLKAESVYINADNRWRRNDTDTAVSDQFKVGSSTKYLYFDGTNLTFTGNLSAAGGTFSGNLSAAGGTFSGDLSAAGGTFSGALSGGTIDIGGSDATSFHVDSTGNMWLGASTYAAAPFKVNSAGDFSATSGSISGDLISGGTISGTSIDINGGTFKVTSSGALTATNAEITGEINATSGSISGDLLVGGTINSTDINGVNITGVSISGSSLQVGGRILLPIDGGQILLGTDAGGTATQCYIFAGGSQGLFIDTSNVGSMWIAGQSLFVNLNQFTSARQIIGLTTFGGSGTPLSVLNGEVIRQTSKRELKENIQDFNNISLIDKLKPRTFNWKHNPALFREESHEEKLRRESSTDIGFIAEEVEEASDGMLSIYNYEENGDGEVTMYKHLDILALSVANIQDLRRRIRVLEQQLGYNS